LAQTVEEEAQKMPIEIDLRENEVIGREIRRAEQASLQKGRQEGRQEGEVLILRRLIEKRFGPMPGWAAERLAVRTAPELEELSVRVLDAPTLEDLLQ
jgi:predicted transposase YdaD